MMLPTTDRSFFQVAYYVSEIESAVESWNRLYGAGPFFVLRHHQMDRMTFRGTVLAGSEFPDLTYALGYLGDLQIQLTVQHDARPSVFRDMYANGGEGFHHVAYFPRDFEEECARLDGAGVVCGCRFESDGVAGAYYDTRAQMGGFTEVHTSPAPMLGMFAEWRRAHQFWQPGDRIAIEL